MKRSLLIMSCSGKKDKTPGLIPAWQRYTGPPCWTPRRAKRENRLPENLDILIISAKYGLLRWDEPIKCYNQKIDNARAMELRPRVQEQLEAYLNGKSYDQFFNCLWDDYNKTVEGFDFDKYCREVVPVKTNRGKKIKQLKKWIKALYQKEQS